MKLLILGYILGIIFGILLFYNIYSDKTIGAIFVGLIPPDKDGRCMLKIQTNDNVTLNDIKNKKYVRFKVIKCYDDPTSGGDTYEQET